jgi:hypothetical protein
MHEQTDRYTINVAVSVKIYLYSLFATNLGNCLNPLNYYQYGFFCSPDIFSSPLPLHANFLKISSHFCFYLPFCTSPFPYSVPFHRLVSLFAVLSSQFFETFITPAHHIPVYVMKNITRACTVPRHAFLSGRNSHHNLISVRP